MALRRMEGESFEDYRERRKLDNAETKEKMKPVQIWTSSIVVPNAKQADRPEYLRDLVKVPVRGTFDRSKGHKMPNSLSEKRRRERAIEKLKKQGIIK